MTPSPFGLPHEDIIAKSVAEWTEQLTQAATEIKQRTGRPRITSLYEAHDAAPAAFRSLVEALVALTPYTRRVVPPQYIRLAGLGDAEYVIPGAPPGEVL